VTDNPAYINEELSTGQLDNLPEEMFKRAYHALVLIFVYTIGELSTSLPESDEMAQLARLLRPMANKLLASIGDKNNQNQPSEQEISELLDNLITSGKLQMEVINHLSLLPLVQKMRMYRLLLHKVNPA
jgi:hypothetical protein